MTDANFETAIQTTDHTTALIEAEFDAKIAMKAFNRAIAALENACDTLECGHAANPEKEVMRDLKVMNAASLFAQQMKEKARDAGSTKYGDGAGGVLDLGTARAEIGQRLACLRSTRRSGAVPVRPE